MGKVIGIEALRREQYRYACQCYNSPNHPEIRYSLDTKNHLVFCSRCGNIVDPFVALSKICDEYEQINREFERAREDAVQMLEVIRNYQPHRLAIKALEESMERGGHMLPCCPHCKKPFDPADINHYVNRDFAIKEQEETAK